jgi:hypothetical protein
MQYIKQKNAQKRGKLILIPARMFHSGTLVLCPSFQALQIAIAKTFFLKSSSSLFTSSGTDANTWLNSFVKHISQVPKREVKRCHMLRREKIPAHITITQYTT